jgi:16S rRNA (cytosine1402-N4)-methyltransferase
MNTSHPEHDPVSPSDAASTSRAASGLDAQTVHVSVMPDEIIEAVLQCDAVLGCGAPVIVDGTYGGGGHSHRLLQCLPESQGHVVGMDRDPSVFRRFESETHDPRLQVFIGSYEATPKALAYLNVPAADALVLDLGLSSDQLADRSRGFSYMGDGELDLRFDNENDRPAWRWLEETSETDIANAIYKFGEERYSRRIARDIVQAARERRPVRTVDQLVDICRRCVPRGKHHDIHPATRTFQALRIAVNDELGILERTLAAAPDWIAAGGIVAIISFHSLEDRIVKQAFRDDARWEVITRKPLRPSEKEVFENVRSRSAKLRVARRVAS